MAGDEKTGPGITLTYVHNVIKRGRKNVIKMSRACEAGRVAVAVTEGVGGSPHDLGLMSLFIVEI